MREKGSPASVNLFVNGRFVSFSVLYARVRSMSLFRLSVASRPNLWWVQRGTVVARPTQIRSFLALPCRSLPQQGFLRCPVRLSSPVYFFFFFFRSFLTIASIICCYLDIISVCLSICCCIASSFLLIILSDDDMFLTSVKSLDIVSSFFSSDRITSASPNLLRCLYLISLTAPSASD